MRKHVGIDRRAVLKAIPAAAVLAVAAEGGLARQSAVAAPVPLPQPTVRNSVRSVLELTLDVRFTDTAVPGYGTVNTRTYNGTIPGPTLRVRGGDTLRLTQVNGLPPNGADSGAHNRPHNANSFNLHTHGMHVSPSGDADNVLREFAPRTADQVTAGAPEPQYVTTIDVPSHHPAGTFWYHPHLHGAVAGQLAGGMAGVIIVEGDVDEVPEIKAAADVVVCINELRLKDGRVPEFTSGGSLAEAAPTFTVNGAVNPTLTLRPGEVQRWRLVAATAFTALPLRITGDARSPAMHQIAQDGITFPAPVTAAVVAMAMGNRADVLVQGGEAGTYELRADGVSTPLMTVEVAGQPVEPPMRLPDSLPQGKPFLDEKAIANPDADREVVFHTDSDVNDGPFPDAFRVLGTHATPAADPKGDLTRDPAYGLFDPAYVNHTLHRDSVERWTLRTDETVPGHYHAFHLHTNHVLVTHRNGTRLDPPVWYDTVGLAGGNPGDQVALLVKYEDFTGRTVAHCHQLVHEELGMMQNVEYVAGQPGPLYGAAGEPPGPGRLPAAE